jgi:hypothetical protein
MGTEGSMENLIIIRCIETLNKFLMLIIILFISGSIFMGMCNGRRILHIFLYNPMIKESGWIPQSIHKTRKGAELAMETHKEEVLKDWPGSFKSLEATQDWRLCEYELLD